MIEIHFVEREIQNPSTKIVWCGDKETLQEVGKIPDPILLVSVIPNTGTEEDPAWNQNKQFRALFPFKDGVGYLSLSTKGQNKIQGVVLRGPMKLCKERFLKKDCGEYWGSLVYSSGEMFDDDGNALSRWIPDKNDAPHTDSMLIDVPDGIFAPEPPQWEKNWVLWLLDDKGVDQCSYRKRRLFAYLVQPFVFLVRQTIILVATLLSLLLGMRGLSLRFFLHPLTINFMDIFNPDDSVDWKHGLFEGGSIFIRPTSEKLKRDFRSKENVAVSILKLFTAKCWPILFFPPLWIGFFLLSYFNIHFLPVVGVFIATGFTILITFGVVDFFVKRFEKNSLEKKEFKPLKVPAKFDNLVCTGEVKLPKKQSVKLHFLDVKAKVCRPFSR